MARVLPAGPLALAGIAVILFLEGCSRVAPDNAQQALGTRLGVIVEQPVPTPLVDRGTWTPASAAALGMNRDQLVDELSKQPIPLPDFERRRPPVPIWVVEDLPSEGQRVVPQTYIECGTMPTGFVLPQSGDQTRMSYDLPLGFPDPAEFTGLKATADIGERVGVAALPGTGAGVVVGIVDRGFLHGHRRPNTCADTGAWPCLDASLSFPQRTAGQVGNDHATMVAYDVTIAAPEVTLADLVLREGSRVCDAAALHELFVPAIQNGLFNRYNGAVLVNAWQVYDTTAPGFDEISKKEHPLNQTISTLNRLGVDIVFAAGNCGPTSPVSSCNPPHQTISGANSHPDVLTVGAASADSGAATGYSTMGPGALTKNKPDVLGISDFVGSQLSGVGAPDTHTSAAAALVAGIVAAYRSAYPYDRNDPSTYPRAVREILQRKTEPCGNPASKHGYVDGWGLLTARCGLRP